MNAAKDQESNQMSQRRQTGSRVAGQRQDTSPLKRGSSDGHENQSADSFAEQGTASSPIVQSMTDTAESASQILNRSDVFHSPTMRAMRRRSSDVGETIRRSDETTRSTSAQLDLDRAGR